MTTQRLWTLLLGLLLSVAALGAIEGSIRLVRVLLGH